MTGINIPLAIKLLHYFNYQASTSDFKGNPKDYILEGGVEKTWNAGRSARDSPMRPSHCITFHPPLSFVNTNNRLCFQGHVKKEGHTPPLNLIMLMVAGRYKLWVVSFQKGHCTVPLSDVLWAMRLHLVHFYHIRL